MHLIALATLAAAADKPKESAKDPRLDVSNAARPIAIGRFNISAGAETGLERSDVESGLVVTLPLRFGVSKDLELFLSPEYRTSEATLSAERFGAIYRFVNSKIELGATAYTDLSVISKTNSAQVVFGFPLRIHGTKMISVDTGILGLITVIPATYTGVQIPIGVNLNPTKSLFFNVNGAARIGDFTDIQNAFEIPFTTTIGVTLPRGEVPLADIGVRADWNNLRTYDFVDVVGFVKFYVFP